MTCGPILKVITQRVLRRLMVNSDRQSSDVESSKVASPAIPSLFGLNPFRLSKSWKFDAIQHLLLLLERPIHATLW